MRTSHKYTHISGIIAGLIILTATAWAQLPQDAASPVQVSDQKAGSLLVFPFYGSDGTTANDTRISITNIGPTPGSPFEAQTISNTLNVHLFWLDGSSCSQADGYICFTKFQQWVLKASEWDPVTPRGVLIAVAVDPMGYPIAYNGLIGNAFVNCDVVQNGVTEKWLDNYGAEAFAAVGAQVPPPQGLLGFLYPDTTSVFAGAATANLLFNNGPRRLVTGYDGGANSFAAEFQSTRDAIGQTILTVGLTGTIGGALDGNTVDNNSIAAIYRADEKLYSWTGGSGGCQVLVRLTDTNPRIVGGLGTQIGTGKTGTAIWVTTTAAVGLGGNAFGNAVGLFITPNSGNNTRVGIRGLHKRDTGLGTLRVPVFMPVCVI